MKPTSDNTIIGWYKGKALLLNEAEELCYYEIPEEFAVIGEVLPDANNLETIDTLSPDEILEIMNYLADKR